MRRGDVDYPPPSAPLHAWYGKANAVERGGQIDGDDGVPFVDREVFDGGHVLYAGVVDEDVNGAELSFGIGDHRLDRIRTAHIGRVVGHRHAVSAPDLNAQRVDLFCVAKSVEHDAAAGGGECIGDAKANPAG